MKRYVTQQACSHRFRGVRMRATKPAPKPSSTEAISKRKIVKVEAEVIDTISVGLFLMRVAMGSRASLELTSVGDGVWLPDRLQVFASARLGLLKAIRFEHRVQYSRYSCLPADARATDPAKGRDVRSAKLNQFATAISP